MLIFCYTFKQERHSKVSHLEKAKVRPISHQNVSFAQYPLERLHK